MLKKTRFLSYLSLFALLSLAWGIAWWNAARADTAHKKAATPSQWAVLKIELPASDEPFPPGVGGEIANSQCQICHSAGMILTQPPLKKDEWRAEIVKMRTAYGAPIPEDQIDGLSAYLTAINGRQ